MLGIMPILLTFNLKKNQIGSDDYDALGAIAL